MHHYFNRRFSKLIIIIFAFIGNYLLHLHLASDTQYFTTTGFLLYSSNQIMPLDAFFRLKTIVKFHYKSTVSQIILLNRIQGLLIFHDIVCVLCYQKILKSLIFSQFNSEVFCTVPSEIQRTRLPFHFRQLHLCLQFH
jgi:hypothetical protein